jgi:DUF1680 family protein
MWNWRMLLVTGDGRYADLLEHTLFNSVLSGLALDGKNFFYMNPLLSRGGYERKPWYDCACCPPNLMRLLASLGQYVVTRDETGLQVHLYSSGVMKVGQGVAISMQTDYPWQGHVHLTVQETDGASWVMRLRKPAWSQRTGVVVNGQVIEEPQIEAGYIVLDRTWQPGDVVELDLIMEPRLIEANPRVDSVRGSVAIQRGSLVYCLEAADHPQINLMDVRLDVQSPLQAVWRDDLMTIQATGLVLEDSVGLGELYRALGGFADMATQSVPLIAIPFYAWANRGANPMRVWIPRA